MKITTDMIVGTGLVVALLAAIFVAVAQSYRRHSAAVSSDTLAGPQSI